MARIVPRKFDRKRYLTDVMLRRTHANTEFKAHAIDLGEAGMAIFTTRFVEVGELIEVVVAPGTMPPGHSGRFAGSVAHARVENDGNILGIEFTRPLNAIEMRSLIAARGKN